jgi:hypothetical protein
MPTSASQALSQTVEVTFVDDDAPIRLAIPDQLGTLVLKAAAAGADCDPSATRWPTLRIVTA